jgi:hypothetical protein
VSRAVFAGNAGPDVGSGAPCSEGGGWTEVCGAGASDAGCAVAAGAGRRRVVAAARSEQAGGDGQGDAAAHAGQSGVRERRRPGGGGADRLGRCAAAAQGRVSCKAGRRLQGTPVSAWPFRPGPGVRPRASTVSPGRGMARTRSTTSRLALPTTTTSTKAPVPPAIPLGPGRGGSTRASGATHRARPRDDPGDRADQALAVENQPSGRAVHRGSPADGMRVR